MTIEIELCNGVSNYQIDMKRIRITSTQQVTVMGNALKIKYFGVGLYCVNSSSKPTGRIVVRELKVSEYYGVDIIGFGDYKEKVKHNMVLFNQCKLSNLKISDFTDRTSHATLDTWVYSIIIRNSTFENKYRKIHGTSYIYASTVNPLLIDNCSFLHNWGGSGLHVVDSVLHFSGTCTFYNNTAKYGGGILMMGSKSVLYLLPHTTLNFTKNSALITGGALHVETSTADFCLIQLAWNLSIPDIKSNAEKQDIQVVFKNNTAGVAGTAIWGGSLETPCFIKSYQGTADPLRFFRNLYLTDPIDDMLRITHLPDQFHKDRNIFYINPIDLFRFSPLTYPFNKFRTNPLNFVETTTAYLPDLFGVVNNESSPSAISSLPQDLCYCNGTIVCTSSPWNNNICGPSFTLYPGQSLEVEIAIAGQLNGLVPGLVQAELKQTSGTNAHFGNLEMTQRVNQAKCTVLKYTIYSSIADTEVQLKLFLANYKTKEHESEILNYKSRGSYYIVPSNISIMSSVVLISCPVGFQHNQSIGSCTCLKALLHYMDNTSCDINTQTVQRTPTLWISASFTEDNTQTLAVHQHCPFDYCDPNKHRLDLSYPHQQCAHNRLGILCGECRRGLSLTLGSPKCKQCSNRYLSLLLVFPLAGIALVAVLTCLNLTVSVGTINGLILYANIIRAIHPVFFPSTNFLSVFVAWMNLDIGMESCLYDGMDFYGLTWLQFAFPVYIWLLVSVMIITSHYSTTAAKLVSRDAVKVLATLFLLSYAKLLRTIITVLSFTYISYEDSDGTTYRSAVWLYDGNVGFVEGKHIPLFLVAIGFGVLYIIPFTVLLLLAPFLQARSHRYTALRWVNKLMPFLDAYQGPYNSRFRFWSGLLLVARVVLFVGFAVNSLGDPQINLKLIVTFLISLFSLQWLLGIAFGSATLYKEQFINVLEAFYLCNLGVLSTWSLLQVDRNTTSRKAQTIITSVCVGLAFLVWVCILTYHAYLWLTQVECVTRLWQTIKGKGHPADETSDPISPQAAVQQHSAVVQKSYIELRESLLTDN